MPIIAICESLFTFRSSNEPSYESLIQHSNGLLCPCVCVLSFTGSATLVDGHKKETEIQWCINVKDKPF